MYRYLGTSLFLAALMFLATGCPPAAKSTPVEMSVVLKLPGGVAVPSYAPERVSKLTVNGKNEPVKEAKPHESQELTIKVAGEAGKSVTLVYSFWPYSYSNTIRTKEVKLEAGKKVDVDFSKEDADHPDLIKPIYVPTPQPVVDEMCKYAQIGKDDIVYDIGCGDGRLVITSVKTFGAKKGVGVDIDADLVKKCQKNAAEAGVADKVEFRNENALLMKDLSDATVVLLYVGEDFGKVLEPVLRKTLKPGARVVSHRFPLGDWEPDEQKTLKAKNNADEEDDYVLKLWTIKHEPIRLTLRLPASPEPYSHRPERVPKLTVNGKDEPIKWGDAKVLKVNIPGSESPKKILIEYSFWPTGYSNTIRTKEVLVQSGKDLDIDFSKEDPSRPDLIKPIFFPTPVSVVDEMCKMAKVGKDDVVYDIGCGDGRMVIAGVKKFGAKKGVGVDIDPDLIKLCNKNAKEQGVADKVEFRNENALLMRDLSDATVVLLYVGEDFGEKLEPVLRKTLKSGARVVSHRFPLGKWAPDTEKTITAKNNYDTDEEYILKMWTIK